jgi:hypothetical protein
VRKEESVMSVAPKEAGPTTKTLAFEVDGVVTRTPVAIAYVWEDGLDVHFLEKGTGCQDGADVNDTYADFAINEQPAYAMTRGAKTGVAVAIGPRTVPQWEASVIIEPIANVVAGARTVGELWFDRPGEKMRASGAFELVVCDLEPAHEYRVVASTAPLAKLAGNIGGKAFTLGTAVAVVRHDDEGAQDYVESIELFEKPGLDCTKWSGERTSMAQKIAATEIGGAGAKQGFLGSAQSIHGKIFSETASSPLTYLFPSWVSFSAFDLAAGKVAGTMSLAWGREAKTAAGTGRVEGEFLAIVCPG